MSRPGGFPINAPAFPLERPTEHLPSGLQVLLAAIHQEETSLDTSKSKQPLPAVPFPRRIAGHVRPTFKPNTRPLGSAVLGSIMAWRCSGRTNTELIEKMAEAGLIKSERVKQAMLNVDRAHFAPSNPYRDAPQSIGHAATISAPHMHAAACEALLPRLGPGARVLDVGSGSGYLTRVLAELVRPGGTVVGVEHIAALVELGRGNVGKAAEGRELLGQGRVVFVKGDGREGWSGEGGEEGWDAVHVGAAAREEHAQLVAQLKRPGRLFVPVEEQGGVGQWIWVVDKDVEGNVTRRREMGVKYVPLTDAPAEARE